MSAGVQTRARGKHMTIIDVIIKTPDRKWTGDVNDVMPGSDELSISDDFLRKKTVSLDLRLDEGS